MWSNDSLVGLRIGPELLLDPVVDQHSNELQFFIDRDRVAVRFGGNDSVFGDRRRRSSIDDAFGLVEYFSGADNRAF